MRMIVAASCCLFSHYATHASSIFVSSKHLVVRVAVPVTEQCLKCWSLLQVFKTCCAAYQSAYNFFQSGSYEL